MPGVSRSIGKHKRRRVRLGMKALAGRQPLIGATMRKSAIKFSTKDCQVCSCRSLCTHTDRRTITVREEEHHVALQKARERQQTPEFRKLYHKRVGIEATMSQGVRAFGMRRSRYEGLAKTHFQHLACATAINIVHGLAWLEEPSVAPTRVSHFAALNAWG